MEGGACSTKHIRNLVDHLRRVGLPDTALPRIDFPPKIIINKSWKLA